MKEGKDKDFNGTESEGQGFGSDTSGTKGTAASATRAAKAEGSNEETSPAGVIKEGAQELLSKAKDVAGEAYETASETAASKLDEHKATLTSGLSGVAESVRQVGSNLRESEEPNPITNITAEYGDRLAGGIETVSKYFEQNDLRAMAKDAEDFARRNPALFIGGAFALGLLAARFLKSSRVSVGDSESNPTVEGKSNRLGTSKKAAKKSTAATGDAAAVTSEDASGSLNGKTGAPGDSFDNPV